MLPLEYIFVKKGEDVTSEGRCLSDNVPVHKRLSSFSSVGTVSMEKTTV